MKKALLIFALCLTPFAASAEDKVIHLDGNAKVITNGNSSNTIYRSYDTDDLIVHRLLGHNDGYYRRPVPTNDYSSICGNVNRASERRRCREDVRDLNKDRAELYRRYND